MQGRCARLRYCFDIIEHQYQSSARKSAMAIQYICGQLGQLTKWPELLVSVRKECGSFESVTGLGLSGSERV